MDNELQLLFRFATKEDSAFFANAILLENDTRIKLAQYGWDERDFDCDAWKVTLIASMSVRRGDDYVIERVGYVSVKGGDIAGFNYIGGFYVLPEFRKQGVGRELLKRAQEFALDNWNAVGVDLYTIENTVMEHLVKLEGFKLEGVDKHKYHSNGKFYCQKRWIKLY